MQLGTPALDKTGTNLDLDFVTTRGAAGNLVQQFCELSATGHDRVGLLEPMTQQVRQPGLTQLAQPRNLWR